MNEKIDKSIERVWEKLTVHRNESYITCEKSCWCWEIEFLLALLEAAKAEPTEFTSARDIQAIITDTTPNLYASVIQSCCQEIDRLNLEILEAIVDKINTNKECCVLRSEIDRLTADLTEEKEQKLKLCVTCDAFQKVDHLTAEVSRLGSIIGKAKESIQIAQAQTDVRIEQLKKHGGHTRGCLLDQTRFHSGEESKDPCTCGWSKIEKDLNLSPSLPHRGNEKICPPGRKEGADA